MRTHTRRTKSAPNELVGVTVYFSCFPSNFDDQHSIGCFPTCPPGRAHYLDRLGKRNRGWDIFASDDLNIGANPPPPPPPPTRLLADSYYQNARIAQTEGHHRSREASGGGGDIGGGGGGGGGKPGSIRHLMPDIFASNTSVSVRPAAATSCGFPSKSLTNSFFRFRSADTTK